MNDWSRSAVDCLASSKVPYDERIEMWLFFDAFMIVMM